MTPVALDFTTHLPSDFLEYSATIEEKQVNDVYLSVAFPCFGLVSWKYREKLIMVNNLLDNSLGLQGAYHIYERIYFDPKQEMFVK